MWQQMKKLRVFFKYLHTAYDSRNRNVRKSMRDEMISNMLVDLVDEAVSFYAFAAWYEKQLEALLRAEYTYPIEK